MSKKVIGQLLIAGRLAKIEKTQVGVRFLLNATDGNRLVFEYRDKPLLQVGDFVEGSGKILGVTTFDGEIFVVMRSERLKAVPKERLGSL